MRDKKLSDPSSQVCSLGSKVTGLVSYLEEDNGFFWLQRNPERVEELGESLESQVVECVVEQGSVGVGEMAVAHWQEAYYRALVVKEEEDNLLLRFVDWGNMDWVSKSLVWPASLSGADESPLAIRCRLEGSCCVKWVEELEKSNYAVNLHCISLEQDILANVVYVMVLVKEFSDSLNSLPLKKALPGEVVGVYDNGRSPSILFSPDMLLNNMTIIEEKLKALEPSSLTPLPTSLFVPGQPCLSRFSGDGVLYRASVCAAPQDDLVEVMYVDYGNSEKKATIDVMCLPDELADLGPATIKVNLARPLKRQVPPGSRRKLKLEMEHDGEIRGKLLRSGGDLASVQEVEEEENEESEDLIEEEIELKESHPKLIEDEIEVQLTYVEDVRNIWVSKVEDIAKVDQIVEKLSASPNLVKLPSVALGQLAMAKSEEDGSLGRVKVETIQEKGFGVRYIDYGNVEEKLCGELYVLPGEVDKIPSLAFLVEVVTEMPNTEVEVQTLYDALDGKNLSLRRVDGKVASFFVDGVLVHPERGNAGGHSPRKVTYPAEQAKVEEILPLKGSGDRDIGRKQTRFHVAEEGDANKESRGACDVKSQDEESQGISVTITHVENDNKVWVTSQQEELDLLMEELASLVLEPAYHVNMEDTVAIIFSEDGVLYRGRLIDDKGTVLFIDYGNTEVKQVEDMFKLPDHLQEANTPAFATAVQVASSGGRGKLEELMGLDEVFMRMNNAGEAELSLGSSKVSFDITGVVAQPTEEGVCVKDQPQSNDGDRQDLKTNAAHRNETANVKGEGRGPSYEITANTKKEVETSLEEARTAWISGCLQMLSGKQSWEHDKEKETPANDDVATFSIEEVSTKAGSAYFVEKLMSGGEAIRTDILDQLLSMDIEQLACDPNSSKVVQAAVLAMKNHPNHASQLIANLASNLPKLATHPHGYLPLLSAFNAADLKQQGEFTTWLENEAVLLKLLNSDFGAFVLCQMMGEMTPGQTASLQVILSRAVLPHLPQLAELPSSLHFLQKLVEGEAQEGGQLLALTLLKDKSMARLASNPTGHLLLGTIVALNPSTYALVAAIWISENFSTLVASPYFGKFSSTVLQLLLSDAENRDFASMLERWVEILTSGPRPLLVEVSNNPQMRDWLSSLLGVRGEVDEKKPHFSMKNNVPSIVDS